MARGGEALHDFAGLRIERHAHLTFSARISELRESTAAYDAAYLALAEVLTATPLTCDAALASLAGIQGRVEVI